LNQRWLYIVAGVLLMGAVATVAITAQQGTDQRQALPGDQIPPTRAAREERAIQEARRQQLAEREAALAAKEGELKKLGERIDAQLQSLEETKKKYEELLKAEEERQKQLQGERVTKTVKLFKTLKAAQSAKLLDGMEESEVRLILDRLDTKTVAKLVPNINQPRTIRWVNENLRKRAEKE
jgi:flagellar motility protein MotE (MotC chaperone)